jgi:sugar phosphate isomerase/epimerase
VHLSDNAGKGWDSHLPLGEGVLPVDDFLDELAVSGYRGAVTLEVDLRRELEHPGRAREIMRADRERCESHLGAALGD